MQICNNYTFQSVIIEKYEIQGFILKRTNMNLQKSILRLFCVSVQVIAFIKTRNMHTHTHNFK